ncbi:DMT family transporter [Sphingomonas montanisoli]|nr:EamA family transporter [Sphingomonas montanisoli]
MNIIRDKLDKEGSTRHPAADRSTLSAAGHTAAAPLSKPMDGRAWGLLCALSLMWGTAFYFTTVQLQALPPLTIVMLRVGLAATALLGWMGAAGLKFPNMTNWPIFLGLGLLNNVLPFALLAFAQQSISSSLAGILTATTPLWGVLIAHFFTDDERATPSKIAAVLLGAAGVAAMAGNDAASGLSVDLLAQCACLGASLSYASAAVLSRRYLKGDPSPLAVSTAQFCVAAVIMVPVALWIDRPWTLPMPGPTVWTATAGAVLISTVFAYLVYFKLIARVGASTALLVTFTVPAVAMLLGIVFLGETLLPAHILGMALIALGLAAIDGRFLRIVMSTGGVR